MIAQRISWPGAQAPRPDASAKGSEAVSGRSGIYSGNLPAFADAAHSHARALVSVANRLLAVDCTMFRNHTCYRLPQPAEDHAA